MNQHPEDHRIAVIGDGKVGRALYRYFRSCGARMECIVTRHDDRVSELRRQLDDVHVVAGMDEIPESANVLLVCVQDIAIAETAASLRYSGIRLEGVTVAHTSGLRTSDELAALADSGACTGCLHPIQSFHSFDMDIAVLQGIGCGIEGSEDFSRRALPLSQLAGWNALIIRKQDKALYHAGCVYAGNFIVALAEDAHAILSRTTGTPVSAVHLLPIIRTVLARLEDTLPKDAITGPAVRGDVVAAGMHMEALRAMGDDFRDIYAGLTRRILDIAGADNDTIRTMLDALHPPELSTQSD